MDRFSIKNLLLAGLLTSASIAVTLWIILGPLFGGYMTDLSASLCLTYEGYACDANGMPKKPH